MATAKKSTKQKSAQRREDHDPESSPRKARSAELTTVLDAPHEDDRREDNHDDIARRERRGPKADINADPRNTEDRVFDVSTRARWGGPASIKELNDDAALAEKSAQENQE